MRTEAPAYFTSFKCIADKCIHSCCIGWEIMVDDDTLRLYNSGDISLGKEICKNIAHSSQGAYFITDDNKKCPFLTENGLCHIINEAGEDWLCQICRDHPRFRNFYSDRVEMGLGMCCEEAARIILFSEDNSPIIIEDDGMDFGTDEEDLEFFEKRSSMFELLHNDTIDFSEIFAQIKSQYPKLKIFGTPLFWHDFLKSLECMDISWEKYIRLLLGNKSHKLDFTGVPNLQIKNIFEYFLYRHLPKTFEGYSFETCISFCLISTALICLMFKNSEADKIEDLNEIARMYSCEIEYSDENTYAIMDIIEETV